MKTKVRIDRKEFNRVLGIVGSIIPSKTVQPIVQCVQLKYSEEKKTFSIAGTDTDTWLDIEAVDKAGEPFIVIIDEDRKDPLNSICIKYTDIKKIISMLPDAYMLYATFTSNDNGGIMHVEYGTKLDAADGHSTIGCFDLPFEDGTDFPLPPAVAVKNDAAEPDTNRAVPVCRFSISADELLPIIKQARSFCADDELRPVMNGECLDVYHDHLVIVATNGHTLFKDVIEKGTGWLDYGQFPAYDQQTQVAGSAKVIVPKVALSAIIVAFQAADTITITVDTQRMEWHAEGVTLTTCRVEGKYPNYDGVIPQNSPHKVTVNRESLRQALRRLSLFAPESSQLAVMKRQGGSFAIEASDYTLSRYGLEYVNILEGDAFLPDGFNIGFKISPAICILDAITTDNIVLFFSDNTRAFLYKPEDVKSARVLLQMPMLVNA